MTDKHVQAEAPHSNMQKDPSDWVTGDEPMTGAQKSYLKTLSEEAGTEFDESLTKAAASEQIDALQQETGRGTSGHHASGSAATKVKPAPAPAGKDGHSSSTNDLGRGELSNSSSSDKQEAGAEEAPQDDLFEAEGASRATSR